MGKGGGRRHRCIKVPISSTLGFKGTGVAQVSSRYIQVTGDAPLAAHRAGQHPLYLNTGVRYSLNNLTKNYKFIIRNNH